ncbi:MAG: NAD+ synthase [Candidatus Cloacimonetes bacterium]|nr:NAD+ synthase [Candidatus Cloacimonadota bacterium]
MRQLDYNKEIDRICSFIDKYLHKTRFSKVIVGLSGGIDSALTAALCVKTLGSQNVIGVMMPYKNSHPDSLNHAKEVANQLNIHYEIIPISDMVDTYFNTYQVEADQLRRGNRMARERMCILFDLSAKHRALVAGTSNKSEIFVGYCTQYGDSACAFEPIAHLYKTEVKEMSKALKLPESVINKNPTADLWDGQTDEKELGISYKDLDEILHYILDKKLTLEEIQSKGIDKHKIELVISKIKNSEFKRKMPEVIEKVWE